MAGWINELNPQINIWLIILMKLTTENYLSTSFVFHFILLHLGCTQLTKQESMNMECHMNTKKNRKQNKRIDEYNRQKIKQSCKHVIAINHVPPNNIFLNYFLFSGEGFNYKIFSFAFFEL